MAEQAMALAREIFPLPRSITGDGVRATLRRVAELIPIETVEVPTGTPVLDWEVPLEWNYSEAYVLDPQGRRCIDVANHGLHLVGYSAPFNGRISLDELQTHLHSIPSMPDAIPYRTSYYRESWGFCVTDSVRRALPPGEYEVVIKSRLTNGSLSYAEMLARGTLEREVLLSTHTCHPTLANDNCAGIAVLSVIARELSRLPLRLSYRIVFAPGTIGAITWLARNRDNVSRVQGGLVLGLLGDRGPLTYKRSRRGDSETDRIAAGIVKRLDERARVVPFSPYGYDERQYCSPGFDLPVGRLTRSPEGGYPEYHTSADALELLDLDAIEQSIEAVIRFLEALDGNVHLTSAAPFGEPRLGKRGLFRETGGRSPSEFEHASLWVLNQADGKHGVTDIAEASGLSAELLESASRALVSAGLVQGEGQ